MNPPDEHADRRADVAIGAAARARKLRFKRKPKTEVKFRERVEVDGRLADALDENLDERLEVESDSLTKRENLPEEVEPGVTYRDVRVGWVAGARIRTDRPPDDG